MYSIQWIYFLSFLHFIECKYLEDSSLDLNEVTYHNELSEIYLGSPSIVRLSSGRLVASHDFFGNGYTLQPRNSTVYISDDHGETWTFSSYIKNSYWTSLTVYKDMIYAIGTNTDTNASVIIHRSSDHGVSWSYNENDNGVILFNGSFATGPTPIVIGNQVMYRAVESSPSPALQPRNYQAAMLSCNLSNFNISTMDDPIMSPSNWRVTPPLVFNKEWIPKSFPNMTKPGYLEGNVVIAASISSSEELRILNILRFNSTPISNLAVILELNQTSNTLFFVSIIHFPGGMSKFSIRYDPITETYFSFVNPVTFNYHPTQRNILSLSYSKDLINWTLAIDRLLYDDTGFTVNSSLHYTGFHYVDWQFDRLLPSSNNQSSCIEWNCDGGPHMIYLIRTSYRGANSYHNSNRITFKILKNYRNLIPITNTHKYN